MEDILPIVFKFLKVRDIVTCLQVNKLFNKLCLLKSVWLNLLATKFNVQTISNGYVCVVNPYKMYENYSGCEKFKNHLEKYSECSVYNYNKNIQNLYMESHITIPYNYQHYTLIPQIKYMHYLKSLIICNNSVSVLPSELGQLRSLTRLNLGNNKLVTIPTELGNLRKLKILLLYQNRLILLPTELGNLSNLNKLSVGKNLLTMIPTELGNLKKMQMLKLAGNNITSIPSELGKLYMLQGLRLEHNLFSTIPTELGNFKRTTRLVLPYKCINYVRPMNIRAVDFL